MTEQMVRYQAPSPLMRFQPQTLDEIITMANLFAESGMFPAENGKQTAAQLAVKILAGQELGLTPFAAANGMQIIKGKCTPSANIMAMKVKGSGRYDYRVTEMTDTSVSVDFYENGQRVGVSTFTQADANKAGTQNMGKFPRNMLFARAISNGVKWYAADLFNGVAVYTPDEMGATVDYETGEILDVPQVVIPPTPAATVQHRTHGANGAPKPATTNGNSEHSNTYPTEWKTPFDAQQWAIDNGYCDNKHHAGQSWSNTVKESGGYGPKNSAQVFAAFYAKHVKRAEDAQAEDAETDAATEDVTEQDMAEAVTA